MQYAAKTKIAIIIGIGLIVFVASMIRLPFVNSDSDLQKISHENINKLEEPEEKMLDVIRQEKAELESKIGEKIKFP